jgi:hypothetical protein
MPWTYDISDTGAGPGWRGTLYRPDGSFLAKGYSGNAGGLNDVSDALIKNVGPIPPGTYIIGDAFNHPLCGPVSMRLTPTADTDVGDRDGFLIHGDGSAGNFSASHGCIIALRVPRLEMAGSRDKRLIVKA